MPRRRVLLISLCPLGPLLLGGFFGWDYPALSTIEHQIREHIRVRFGGSYVGRTSGRGAHPIRFTDRVTREMTSAQGKSVAWKRRH
jgi:hypothetical protein